MGRHKFVVGDRVIIHPVVMKNIESNSSMTIPVCTSYLGPYWTDWEHPVPICEGVIIERSEKPCVLVKVNFDGDEIIIEPGILKFIKSETD